MAYYMRSNSASSHGNYMISNSSMQGSYLMHSAKGTEWKKPHKYLDKRWIDGAWKYLYELPKNIQETVRKAGEAAKDTAEKAANTVKDTAQKATKAAKDFKEYSTKVDSNIDRYKEDSNKRDKRLESNNESYYKAKKEAENAGKETDHASDERYEAEKLYGKNSDAYKYAKEAEDEAFKDLDKAEKRLSDLDKAWNKNVEERSKDDAKVKELEAEKETAKYKASKALNKLLRESDLATRQGAQWLKNQLESGNKWAMNTLAAIEEKGTSAIATGNAFLQNLLGKNKQQTSRSSGSSSGRNYSGTGTKAQRREAVTGGPVSDNDYRRRPKR